MSINQQFPNPDLKSLDRLVGTWQASDEEQGQVRYVCPGGGYDVTMTRVE